MDMSVHMAIKWLICQDTVWLNAVFYMVGEVIDIVLLKAVVFLVCPSGQRVLESGLT